MECQDSGTKDNESIVDSEFGPQDANVTNGGGIAERPGNMADIFHTFFGIAGLSLLEYFHNADIDPKPSSKLYDFDPGSYEMIDPTYALPCSLLAKLGVTSQVNADDESNRAVSVQAGQVLPVVDNTADKLAKALAALNVARS